MKLRLLASKAALTAVLLTFGFAAPASFSQDQGGAKPSDGTPDAQPPKAFQTRLRW